MASDKFFVLLGLVLALAGCTSSEQREESERRARREAELDKARHEDRLEKDTSDRVPVVGEPEAPPEPQYEDKDFYVYDGTECETYELNSCGVNFYKCANHIVYECMHNVKYTIKTKRVLVN